MRCVTAAVLVLVWAVAASPADAQTGWGSSRDDQVEVGASTGGGGAGDEPVPGASGGEDGQEFVVSARLAVDADGNPCVARVTVPAGQQNVTPIPPGIPACPPVPVAAGPTPEEWVIEYLDRSAPDRPVPTFIPPEGVTGERMYLVTEADTSWFREVADTPFGPLTLVAAAEVTVDWGDGTVAGPYRTPGTAWPDGEISHVWQVVGDYDVTVTYDWVVEWSFAGANGTLPLDQVATLSEYPVIELQPVIRRP